MSSKADIDKKTGELHKTLLESHWDIIQKAGTNKRILLVEGDDDKRVVEALLDSRARDWTTKVHVGVAGDRGKVLGALKKNPQWYGLVDRDVWDQADIAAVKAELPTPANLTVTEAWCIENHLVVPAALAAALAVDEGALRAKLDPEFDGWLRYGAIWWAVQRKRNLLVNTLADGRCGHPVLDACPDDAALRARLAKYAATLPLVDVDRIIDDVNDRVAAIKALPSERERIEHGIHGKLFFKEVVVDALKALVKQRSTERWREEIAIAFKTHWPAYLTALAEDLLHR